MLGDGLADHFRSMIHRFPSELMEVAEICFLYGIAALFGGSYEVDWASCEARFDTKWGFFDGQGVPFLTAENVGTC